MPTPLTSTAAVMDALGGTQATAEITGRRYNAACNWRVYGKFPANTYLAITRALEARGFAAPASLWGMADADQEMSA